MDGEYGRPGRQTIIHPRNSPLLHLRNSLPNLDLMSYPLTHPYGQPGWHHGILLQHPAGGRHEISMREFYAYKLPIRVDFNPVLESSRLTQQYVVDQWVKTEHQRLQYLRKNQRQLRVHWYRGLHDHVQQKSKPAKSTAFCSRRPDSSAINSPRLSKKYAAALSGCHGHCDQV